MQFKTQGNLTNALIRRVRRHAALATIFRSVEPGNSQPGSQANLPGEKIVQATLLPTIPISPPPYRGPEAHITPEHSLLMAEPSAQKVPTHPPGHMSTDALASGSQQGGLDTEGKGWNRLKAIFNKHQETDTELGSPDLQSEIPPDQNQAEDEANEVSMGTKMGDQQNQLDPTIESPPENFPVEDLAENHIANISASPGSETFDPNRQTSASHQPDTPDRERVEGTPAHKPHRDRAVQTRSSQDLNDLPIPKSPGEPGIVADSISSPKPPDNEISRVDEPKPEIHNVPVDAVWPVQRKELPPEEMESSNLRDQPVQRVKSSGVSARTDQINIEDEAAIYKALNSVKPGHSTASSIEIIPPRGPRPVLVQTHPIKGLPSPASDPLVNQKPAKKGSEPDPYIAPSMTVPKKPGGPETAEEMSRRQSSKKFDPNQTTLQRIIDDESNADPANREPPTQPKSEARLPFQQTVPGIDTDKHGTGSTSTPRVVQTEIGPLPVDLWHLLDQVPPNHQGEPLTPASSTSESEVQSKGAITTGMRVIPPPEPQKPEMSSRDGSTGQRIQRTVTSDQNADEGNAIHQPTNTTTVSAAEGETVQPSELDTDDLARRVYAEVKRRIAVEWERIRR